MGADRGIHVEVSGKDYDNLGPLQVSKIMAALAKKEDAQLIILGKQVINIHLALTNYVKSSNMVLLLVNAASHPAQRNLFRLK